MSQPDPTLAKIIAQLEEQLAAKDQQLARKDQALALAEVKIKLLEERLRLDRIARYGKRSETLSDLQLQLLDLEPGVSSEEVEAESEREPLKAPPAAGQDLPDKPRRKHPGRQEAAQPSGAGRADHCMHARAVQLRQVRQANHRDRLRRDRSARRASGRVLRDA